jgi:sulfotransferase family protein
MDEPGLRVIGVGFGRTGTASLRQALERLGFGPCYHMFVLAEQPWRARRWVEASHGRAEWQAIFAGFGSTVDWPGAAHWREIVAAYPQAKVVLTVRDPQRWYDSMSRTILRGAPVLQRPAVRRAFDLLLLGNRDLRDLAEVVNQGVLDREFGGRYDREHVTAVFERHTAEVRAEVPADRLLVFEVAQAWGPLCAFLGVPVPEEPFPHANETLEFQRWQRRGFVRLAAPRLAVLALAGAAVVVAARRINKKS